MLLIRAAINIKENSIKEIENGTLKLISHIEKELNLKEKDIIFLIVSATKDITKKYPCAFLRENGYKNTAMLCVQEMFVENSMPLTIRFIIQCRGEDETKFFYLNDTKQLRE